MKLKVLGWILIGVSFVTNGYVAFANIDVTPHAAIGLVLAYLFSEFSSTWTRNDSCF